MVALRVALPREELTADLNEPLLRAELGCFDSVPNLAKPGISYRHDLPGDVLFPSPHLGGDRPLTDLRDLLDRVAVRAGLLTPVLDPGTGKQRRTASGRPMWAGNTRRTMSSDS